MKDRLTPDFMFARFWEVTPAFLREQGIRALLIDIDNTLAPYEMPDPDDRIRAWFADLAANGIRAALVSNNNAARVERFNETLGLPAFAKSGKPGKKAVRRALAALGAEPSGAAVLGDQLLTDAYAGKRLGLRAIIVPPIKDKTNAFFRFKRLLERRYIRRYIRAHGRAEYHAFWKV